MGTRREARFEGFDLDAEVSVGAADRDRLEQKRPWRDGTTHVSMTPSAFLGRLCSLVPRPRKNTTLYDGVLAGHARGRARLVPRPSGTKRRHEDACWAALMKHSFGLDVLGCRRCGGRMRLVAVIHDRKEVRRLLSNLRAWSDPLPAHPAPGPPEEAETRVGDQRSTSQQV